MGTLRAMAATRPVPQKRPSGLTVVLAFGIAVVATVALVVVALVFRDNGSSAQPPTPTPVVDLTGIQQQGAILGDTTARVTLIEYADPQCPGCRYYTEEMFPAIVKEYVRPGKVKTEFRGYPFIGPDSVKGYRFLLAAARQNRLWQLQEALYRYQGGENDGWLTDDLLRERAAEIRGLNVNQLFSDAEDPQLVQEAESAAGEAQSAGIPGTPTFFIQIGDEKPYYIQVALDLAQMRAAIDDALKG
jgi:protein-disulfide isomerase